MDEDQPKSTNTVWVVIMYLAIALVVIVLALAIWLGFRYFNNKIDSSNKSASTEEQSTKTETPATTAETPAIPTETPMQAAENFLKSIFSTFPSSGVDLTKANAYLSPTLQSRVNATKESYWDLHGYIHSGPCSVAVSEISSSSTEAEVEIITEWGEDCYGTAEPYYRYKMSVSGSKWIINEIEQLRPSADMEQVPRDF